MIMHYSCYVICSCISQLGTTQIYCDAPESEISTSFLAITSQQIQTDAFFIRHCVRGMAIHGNGCLSETTWSFALSLS